MGSRTVKWIADVSRLRNYQFPQLKCERCGDVTQKDTCVRLNETVALPKITTNLVQKCKFCGREGPVLMVTGRGRPLTHALSQSGQYAPLMLFHCRGYEPVEFAFGSGWKVESMDDDDERITNVRGRL